MLSGYGETVASKLFESAKAPFASLSASQTRATVIKEVKKMHFRAIQNGDRKLFGQPIYD